MNSGLNKIAFFTVLLILPILFFSGFLFLPSYKNQVAAQAVTNLYGAAWSDTVGWISFNYCEELGNCGSVEYGIEVNASGAVVGTAWSDNIGWIKFGGLSGFPTGDGTERDNAKINLSAGAASGKVTGWARACSGTLPGDCSSMTSRSDGWDGWISLSGTLYPSPRMDGTGGVTYNESLGKIVGRAWGGPVVGWIDFGEVTDSPPNVWYGPPPEADFDYFLSNSTETSPLTIPQGGQQQVGIVVNLISGQPQNVEILPPTPPSPSSGQITISFDGDTNCLPNPDCSVNLLIGVSEDVPLGQYSFTVFGDEIEGEPRTTEVGFEVVQETGLPQASCSAEGSFWLYQTVTWSVDVEEFNSIEWTGDVDNQRSEECDGNTECSVFYSTVGPKSVFVSVDGGEPEECTSISIIARIQFREF